jgi:hypothetical protein
MDALRPDKRRTLGGKKHFINGEGCFWGTSPDKKPFGNRLCLNGSSQHYFFVHAERNAASGP